MSLRGIHLSLDCVRKEVRICERKEGMKEKLKCREDRPSRLVSLAMI
jgi:hypothetical protein